MRVRTVLAAAGVAAGAVLTSATSAAAWTSPVPPVAAAADHLTAQVGALAHDAAAASRSAHRTALRHRSPARHVHRARRHHHGRAHQHSGRQHHAPAHHRSRHHAHHAHHASRHAQHARHHGRHAHLSRAQKINRVIAVARSQRGKPYRWGAAGPHAFDCSGFVQWVYRHAIGRHLPKYTDTQYAYTRHVRSARHLHRGDLVFVRVGRHEEHVGIYAGHWRWWVAPHTGSHVKLQHIYPAPHVYSRVIL